MGFQVLQLDEGPARHCVVKPVNDSSEWDKDDWMIFFWSNTKAARECRQAHEEEFPSTISEWLNEVEC